MRQVSLRAELLLSALDTFVPCLPRFFHSVLVCVFLKLNLHATNINDSSVYDLANAFNLILVA